MFVLACSVRPGDCSSVRLGRFRDTGGPVAEFYVTRTEHELIEEAPGEGKVTRSQLVWLDSCTYLAFGRTVLSGKADMGQPTDSMEVHITKVDAGGFDYQAKVMSANPKLDGLTFRGRQVFEK